MYKRQTSELYDLGKQITPIRIGIPPLLSTVFDTIKVKPHVILNASQLYTIQAFVRENLGGAILYSSLLKNMNDVKGIPIAPTISQEIGLVWQKGKYLNSRTEQFIAFTKDFMESQK